MTLAWGYSWTSVGTIAFEVLFTLIKEQPLVWGNRTSAQGVGGCWVAEYPVLCIEGVLHQG